MTIQTHRVKDEKKPALAGHLRAEAMLTEPANLYKLYSEQDFLREMMGYKLQRTSLP
jgi:hypothetical protein